MQRSSSCSLSSHTRLKVFSFVWYLVIPFVSPLHFDMSTSDKNSNDILYEGVAVPADGTADLSPKGTIPQEFQVGRIQYSKPIYIRDSISGRQADFSTNFSFTIIPFNPTKYSDGIALFLAPTGFTIPPNSGGGYLGLFNASTVDDGPRNRIVMVEFDTYGNKQKHYHDSPGQHIGINKNSLSSLVYSKWDPGSHSGNPTNVMVTYNSTSKNLSVFWSFDGELVSLDKKNFSLSYQIDLAEVLPESVAIGISASHGLHGARHIINSWGFTSNLDAVHPPSTNSLVEGIIDSKIHRLLIIIMAPIAGLLLIISAGSCLFMIKMRRKYQLCALTDIDKEIRALPLKFSYQELVVATSGFSQDRRLGQGGSCQVYKGLLNCMGRLVAVKRIFTRPNHSEKVFINEVKIISRTIHRNLVQLIGWCREEGEYLLKGSVRYRVALGLASALNYLHEELEQCILHRDIKAANILLDTDFNTKLGDFGVAKLVDPRFRTQSTDVVGTYGYLAPEYLNGWKATRESDMFSFGVVILEIACGRRTYQLGELDVPVYKWLGSSFDKKEMECLMMVGLWCMHPDPKRRPKAGQIIRFLQLEVPVPELPLTAHEAPILYQPSPLRIGSYCSSSEKSVQLSKMDHGS
ncbi:hypothetical protein BT93_L2089 [Corymbia citriodora subsp. variegata]|uniref:Protein kinase domain-containing protein n=1 Tax=Corymbia citriodora subsp. variegata TaxID=360336 RepID=A0A8T0CKY1_CORYI|nr:hypothetical protein BT93_L2089 [Corymbia citriodora subsp. variegata]